MFAYIGPGAGFALLSSALAGIIAFLVAALSLLIWPFRVLWGIIRRKPRARPLVNRLVILGFDGLDWPVFSTGASGGEHEPFWSVLGQHGVWSTILHVPMAAPKRFAGAQLYAGSLPARSHPRFFASYLAKRLGVSFNHTDSEREAMLLLTLNELRSGAVVSAFGAFAEQHDALIARVQARLTPGDLLIVFSRNLIFCNRPMAVDNPSAIDLAPTALHLFGVNPPAYMQGQVLFRVTPAGAAA